MARIRITLTENAAKPKVVYLGSGVSWYAYVRGGDTLYVQRDVNGVRDPEIAITAPVLALDVIRDPVDSTKGWIYFTHDGILERIQVTPLGVGSLNAVGYNRINGWYHSVGAVGGAGVAKQWTTTDFPPIKVSPLDTLPGRFGGAGVTRSWNGSEALDPPSIVLERTNTAVNVIISLPNRNIEKNRNLTLVYIYRKLTAQTSDYDWAFFSSVAVPPQVQTWQPPLPLLQATVPLTVFPSVTRWAATCVRVGYLPAESGFSNIAIDNGLLPTIYVEPMDKRLGGARVAQQWDTVDFTPVKTIRTDTVSTAAVGGAGITRQWTLNGTNIINP
jgi:hypothetical protein